MRRFYLFRSEDVSGVSGTGIVAEGTQFTSGRVVIEWYGEHPSIVMWQSLDDAMAIHGHNGATTVRWRDGPATVSCDGVNPPVTQYPESFVHPPASISSHIADMDRANHPEDYLQREWS